LQVAEEEVWAIHGGKRGGDGSIQLAVPVKREDQKTNGLAAAMAPVETGGGRESLLVTERSKGDYANDDLADPPDGDFVAGQASRVTAFSVITAAGPLTATVDTRADSIWVGRAEVLEGGGTEFEKEDTLAQSADGSPLAVVGKGNPSFSLWGKFFNSLPVRIVQQLPSGMFLGNRFIIGGLRMSTDFETGQGSFVLPQGKFCGSISEPEEQADSLEEVRAVAEVEVPIALRELDLGEFGTEEEQEALRTLLLKYREVFVPTTNVAIGPDFDIILRPDSNLASLDCPRFRTSRVEKEIENREVTKLLERGSLEPSLSEFGTNCCLFPTVRIL
jgi:hypothetical protein